MSKEHNMKLVVFLVVLLALEPLSVSGLSSKATRYDAIEHKQLGGADLTDEVEKKPHEQLEGLEGLNKPDGTAKSETDKFSFGDMTAFAGGECER